jgi:hypothetical protein
VAGLLFGAAYLTKQSALPCLGLLGLFLLLRRRREGLAVAAAGALTVAAGVAWFMASSDGWYRYYTFEIATGYALQPRNILNFASNQLGPLAPAVVAGVAWAAWPARVRTGVHRTLLVALLSVLFGCFWLSLYPGTAANVAIPAAMACSVMLGLGLDALLERARGWAPTDAAKLVALASGAVAIQWLGLLYTPARYVPSANDVAEGRRLIERIAAEPGEAWIPNHGYLDRLAGRPGQAHALALSNAVHGDRRGLARRVLAEQDSAVARGRYSLLILDADSFQARDPIPGYGPPEELFRDRDVFHTRVGVRTRPEVLRRRLPGSPTALPEQASATGGSAHRPR